MRIHSFLFIVLAFVVLICATPIPSPTLNGGTHTSNQNLSHEGEAATPSLSSSAIAPIVNQKPYKQSMREVILTDEQRAAIESWEEEMWESNSSNLERHNQGVARAVERGQREGKDPSKVADAYRLKGMNDNRSRKLQKSSGRGSSERGRRRIASDPKKIEGWEAKLKEDEVRYRKYMRGMERVRQENKEGVDVEKAVFKYRDDHYKQAQRNAKMLKEIREKRKDVQWGTSGNRSESQLVTTHGQDTPATPSAPPTPHTQNEHQHPEEGNEGDEELRMAFDFQSDTD